MENSPDFTALTAEEKSGVVKPFDTVIDQIKKERLAPVIRQLADRAANGTLPRQLQKVAELAASKKPGELKEGKVSKPVEYIAAQNIAVPFSKVVIESEQDLDDYLDSLRAVYIAQLKQNKRITL